LLKEELVVVWHVFSVNYDPNKSMKLDTFIILSGNNLRISLSMAETSVWRGPSLNEVCY